MRARARVEPVGRWAMDIHVPATAEEIGTVRHALDGLDLPRSLLDDARLLVTELVTNSVKHAGLGADDQVRISVHWTMTELRVDVFDRTDAGDAPQVVVGGIRPGPGAESGWGLFLLDRLASRWGNSPGHYWFEMTPRVELD